MKNVKKFELRKEKEMKKIMLAKKGKRLLSRFIDFLIVLSLTLFIFLLFVFPNSLDRKKINENGKEITRLYNDSGLFIVDEDGNYNAKCAFQNVKEIEDLYEITCVFRGKEYKGISLVESLYTYYTTKFKEYGGQRNLTIETYKTEILNIGSVQSNIKDFNEETKELSLMDISKEEETISYFLDIYSKACKNLTTNSKIQTLTKENQNLFLKALVLIIPVLVGVSFIFDFLIPLCSPNCETIGKHIFKLGVISKKGYKLNKIYLLPRWIAYILLELMGGVFTIGSFILVSYTMFLFTKNRRCMHDLLASTVVIDKENSIYFSSPREESFYINRQKAKEGYSG